MDKYNPKTCITAGELREIGCQLPDTIPDVAWVPRSAIKIAEPHCVTRGDDGILHLELSAQVTVPFVWITVNIEIPAPEFELSLPETDNERQS